MQLNDFTRVRTALQSNASAANEVARRALATDLQDALHASGAFHTVEVESTDDPDKLVVAMVLFELGADVSVLGDRLQRLWTDRLGHEFWNAHAAHVQEGHVELLAATRPNAQDGYLTVHLVARAAEAPVVEVPRPATVPASVEVAIATQRVVARGWAARLFGRSAADRVA